MPLAKPFISWSLEGIRGRWLGGIVGHTTIEVGVKYSVCF